MDDDDVTTVGPSCRCQTAAGRGHAAKPRGTRGLWVTEFGPQMSVRGALEGPQRAVLFWDRAGT